MSTGMDLIEIPSILPKFTYGLPSRRKGLFRLSSFILFLLLAMDGDLYLSTLEMDTTEAIGRSPRILVLEPMNQSTMLVYTDTIDGGRFCQRSLIADRLICNPADFDSCVFEVSWAIGVVLLATHHSRLRFVFIFSSRLSKERRKSQKDECK